jgi:hypothetical protein
MKAIRATIKKRKLEVDVPDDWPDGTEVEIQPLADATSAAEETLSPDEVAKTLAAMDQMQPFDMTDVEQAAWDADRKALRERDKAQFAEHAQKLRQGWK